MKICLLKKGYCTCRVYSETDIAQFHQSLFTSLPVRLYRQGTVHQTVLALNQSNHPNRRDRIHHRPSRHNPGLRLSRHHPSPHRLSLHHLKTHRQNHRDRAVHTVDCEKRTCTSLGALSCRWSRRLWGLCMVRGTASRTRGHICLCMRLAYFQGYAVSKDGRCYLQVM